MMVVFDSVEFYDLLPVIFVGGMLLVFIRSSMKTGMTHSRTAFLFMMAASMGFYLFGDHEALFQSQAFPIVVLVGGLALMVIRRVAR